MRNQYTFQRQTNTGTETLNLAGVGNPLNNGTGLIRSAFRPSDDATIFGFFIPANAMMAVELTRTAKMLEGAGNMKASKELALRGEKLTKAVWEYGVINHPVHGKVFAYEIDGYGSQLLMDDANLPSLLSLPLLGFCKSEDEVYQNTRKMILNPLGNPYYLQGEEFEGIGGPHIGLQNAWPMSLLVQTMTSDSDKEIGHLLGMVKNVSMLGLIHESVFVSAPGGREYTRKFPLIRKWFWVLILLQGVGLHGRILSLRRRYWIWRSGNLIYFLERVRSLMFLNDYEKLTKANRSMRVFICGKEGEIAFALTTDGIVCFSSSSS